MKLVIAGAGGHGRVVADLATELGIYSEIVFLDDSVSTGPAGRRVVGGTDQIEALALVGVRFFVAVGDANLRMTLIERALVAGVHVEILVHPKAIVSAESSLAVGTVICAGAVVAAGTRIGRGCIINTLASVDHDCVLEDGVHVCPGGHIGGSCSIDKRVWLGIGSCVSHGISICADTVIGAGAVVIKSINAAGTYVGNPTRKLGL